MVESFQILKIYRVFDGPSKSKNIIQMHKIMYISCPVLMFYVGLISTH